MTAPKDMSLRERCEGFARHYVRDWDGADEDLYANMVPDLEVLIRAERVRFAERAIWLAAGCIVDTKAIADAIAAASKEDE